ncbi:MAG: helix-turn-helix transcriptional regulator [Ruminococcaceae bacterium]|nr:helix-turn-helix transcriptional regulator [Oscillospiraceae bacterium]
MTVGEKIEQYRKDAKLSQEELASKLFVSRQTVSQWENNQTSPTVDNFLRLCEVFGISMNDFFEDQSSVCNKSCEYDELYKWGYSEEDLNTFFRVIMEKDISRFRTTVLLESLLLIAAICLKTWIGIAVVLPFLISRIISFVINQNLFEKNCKKSKLAVMERTYHFGVTNGALCISIFDAEEMISFDKVYPINIERIWNTEKLCVFQYKQRRYIVKKYCLDDNSQIGDLLGF